MDRYCGSRFWDPNLTWNTTNPDFTECFEETALLWFACGFLWFTAIFDIYFRADSNLSAVTLGYDQPTWRPGWTWLTVFKVLNIALLIFLEITVLCVNWYHKEEDDMDVDIFNVPDVLWITPVILIVTHFFSAVFIVFHKNRCVHTSGIQLLHWLMLCLVQSLFFRTNFNFYRHNPEQASLASLILWGIILGIIIIQAFLFCWSDIPDSKHGHRPLVECTDGIKREECPMVRASCLSYVLFSWCTPLVRKGYKEPLTKDDLWDLVAAVKAPVVSKIYDKYYGVPEFDQKRSVCQNIVKPLWKTCGWSFLVGISCKLASSLMAFLAPKVMGYMIDFVQDKSIETWKGYVWAASLLGIYLVITLFLEQYYLHIFKCYVNIMTCINMKIYQKSMSISSASRKDTTTGEIVNLMAVDTEKIRELIYHADSIWSTPIQVTLGIYLLWCELGYAVFPGVAVICSIIPFNWFLTVISSRYQTAQMKKKDERIKIISEVLSGIQVIKLYAWERSFKDQIKQVRSDEIRILRKRMFVQCIIQFIFDSVPFLVSIAAFFTYVYMHGGVLDPKKAFTAVSLFTLLTDPIADFPQCISVAVDASVSVKRINKFLNTKEIDKNATHFEPKDGDLPAVEIQNGKFAWDDFTGSPWQLSDINLGIEHGTLTAVVGQVGSGKSSLLSAILGLMTYAGDVTVRGRVAYVPQTPWILNATLRDNICFGQPYIKDKYDKVIDACCLSSDIAMLPASDMTEIGEKGINLSGGQKQRVNLARAAYSDAEVILLDDVLSAVDSHVGKHIFENLLGPGGYLSNRTRIICTHAYNFLGQVHKVVVMDDGRIAEMGTYEELIRSNGNFSKLLKNNVQSEKGNLVGHSHVTRGKFKSGKDDKDKKEAGKLIVEERLETGDVKLKIFMAYVRAMKFPLVFTFIFFFGISEALSLARNIVLSKWTEASSIKKDGKAHNIFAIEYGILGLGQSLFYLIGFFLLAISALKATKLIHNNMLKRILRAPMSFFNVTLIGRIVNRFSSDMESLDRSLPNNIGDWICHIFKFLGILIAISYSNAYFVVFIVPLSAVYYILQRHYILCMQQLQRLTNSLKSPIYAQFQETLNGTSTLRAYRAQARFTGILGEKIDAFNRALFPHLIVRRWLSIRLGVLGSTVVFIPALFAVIWRDTMDASLVGLSISYALQITTILSWLIKVTSYIQYNFVSVERVLEYSEIEQEAPFENKSICLQPNWPSKGEIKFEDYETRYRPGLELVLKHFTCHIEPGTKVGIVGRTGAGKSSLTLALFRIIEAVNGEINIDNMNIGVLGLHDLRKRLTVIPQDPVLFCRSLRLNIDPFQEYDDRRLWEALTLAHLKKFVREQPEGLDFPIAEGGENLSVGQRQLICLTRAILRKSSILILDEATASIDFQTDALIQKTIREHFVDCTILNVAHRLNTVLDSTKILVLSRGEIAEYDTPEALLSNPSSHFYSMAKDAGIIE